VRRAGQVVAHLAGELLRRALGTVAEQFGGLGNTGFPQALFRALQELAEKLRVLARPQRLVVRLEQRAHDEQVMQFAEPLAQFIDRLAPRLDRRRPQSAQQRQVHAMRLGRLAQIVEIIGRAARAGLVERLPGTA